MSKTLRTKVAAKVSRPPHVAPVDPAPSSAALAGKHWSEMSAAELAEATDGLEKIRFEDTRPLTPAERTDWERAHSAKRGRGRPPKVPEERAERVLVTVSPALLTRADSWAQCKRMSRSEMVAKGLEALMAADPAPSALTATRA